MVETTEIIDTPSRVVKHDSESEGNEDPPKQIVYEWSPSDNPSDGSHTINNQITTRTQSAASYLTQDHFGIFKRMNASYSPKIRSFTCNASFSSSPNLVQLARKLSHSFYRHSTHNAYVSGELGPGLTYSIYWDGEIIIQGASSEEEGLLACRYLGSLIARTGSRVIFRKFEVSNIDATCDVGFPIKLNDFYQKHNSRCKLPPHFTKRLVYKSHVGEISMSISKEGKVAITGAITVLEIHKAFEMIYPDLARCRLDRS